MTYYCKDVKKFHDKFGLETPSSFTFISEELHNFRVKFFKEEIEEFRNANKNKDLPEAIDALIDLVYITCGCALLYGVQPREFESLAANLNSKNIYQMSGDDESFSGPRLLPNTREFSEQISINMLDYVSGFIKKDKKLIEQSLSEIYVNCLFAASDMGFTEEMWNELWDDVQKCNMKKARATKISESTRESTFDVIKPIGWVPPRTKEIVEKFRILS